VHSSTDYTFPVLSLSYFHQLLYSLTFHASKYCSLYFVLKHLESLSFPKSDKIWHLYTTAGTVHLIIVHTKSKLVYNQQNLLECESDRWTNLNAASLEAMYSIQVSYQICTHLTCTHISAIKIDSTLDTLCGSARGGSDVSETYEVHLGGAGRAINTTQSGKGEIVSVMGNGLCSQKFVRPGATRTLRHHAK
jgi:hypothetical protein